MNGLTQMSWRARLSLAGIAGALAIGSTAALPTPAQARVWVSVGVPFPGYYYGPGSYYDYPPAYSYYPYAPQPYPAPPAYYPQAAAPAPSAYYPQAGYPQAAYPQAAYPQATYPQATYPQATYPQAGYPPAAAPAPPAYAPPTGAAPAPAAATGITYTSKPAFTNASGQTCREYKTTETSSTHPIDVFGTACQQADGQWRVVN